MTNSNCLPDNDLANPVESETEVNRSISDAKREYRKPEVRDLRSLDMVQDTYVSGSWDGGYARRY